MSNHDLDSDPKALQTVVVSSLYNRRLDPNLRASIDAGTALQKGSLREILDLSTSLGLHQFIEANGLAQLENNEQVQAKLAELVSVATSMAPSAAFIFVKQWLQQGEKARDVQTLAHSYMAIATTMDRRSLRAITADTLADKEFTRELGMTVSYDKEIKLPRGEANSIDQDLSVLREATGRKAEVVQTIDYKGAYLVKLLADLLTEATKKHIGTDILTDRPIVYTEGGSTYEDALRYAMPLPDRLKEWEKRGLSQVRVTTDYDHLAFLIDPMKMYDIVKMVLPGGVDHPLFVNYLRASYTWQEGQLAPNGQQFEQDMQLALRNLQEALYEQIVATLGRCSQPLHPRVEIAARNLAWYALSTGEGAKTSPYFAQMQPLNDRGQIDESANLPLSASVVVLKEIAAIEGVDLTDEKKLIGEHLTESCRSLDFFPTDLADKIMAAYQLMQKGGNPIVTPISGEENWYVTTVLFRSLPVLPDQWGTKASKDGQPRSYRSVLELVRFIRLFNAN